MKKSKIIAAEIISTENNISANPINTRKTTSYKETVEKIDNNIFVKFNNLVNKMLFEKRNELNISAKDCLDLQTYIIELKENMNFYQEKINVLNEKIISSQENIKINMSGGSF